MTTHPDYEELNDFADALLEEPLLSEVRTHVGSCAECAQMVQQIRALNAAARALPREMDPPSEVWLAVSAATVNSAPAQRGRVLWQMRYHLAAAAIMLLVIGSMATWWLTQQAGAPTVAHVTNADELMRLLEQRRETLDPAVVRTVEENLRIMDEAIARANTALMKDPSNQDIARILVTAQESRLRMLNRAVRMAGAT